MEDSIFTKIIKGEIPCHKVYEDDTTFAIMDIHPIQPGHVVVFPKVQVDFVWELNDSDYIALMQTVKKVGQRLNEVFPERARIGSIIEGVGISNHAHVNVIPFDTSDELRHLSESSTEPDHEALAEMAKKIAF